MPHAFFPASLQVLTRTGSFLNRTVGGQARSLLEGYADAGDSVTILQSAKDGDIRDFVNDGWRAVRGTFRLGLFAVEVLLTPTGALGTAFV